jgi:hypothetical protein
MQIAAARVPGVMPGLFLVALATVMFEVLLTRIFSLTMWYHFAFMAISVAMFGLTVGALAVFLRPRAWPQAALPAGMGACALLLAVSMAAVVLLHISLYLPSPHLDMLPLVLTFVGVAVPFVFSGVFICLALTRFPQQVGRLYAVDLAGAAIGCLAVVAALRWLDGVGAVLACAALAGAGAVPLLTGRRRALATLVAAGFAGAAVWTGFYLAQHETAAFRILHIKGAEQPPIDYERWNSFSRIAVLRPQTDAVGWNLSTEFKGAGDITSRWLQIDAHAGTQLIAFDGDLEKVGFLRWDLPNFAHHLRSGGRVAVVGAGGGRDVLTAQLFGQKRVLAVEINGDIMRVANGRFGDFTGHLDRFPGVSFVNDEARSYLARSAERFDLLQITFVDTFAATAAGAFALTENSLYTVEGWKVFLERLDADGLLAVSRATNAEIGRLVALGRAALLAGGAAQPERHMVLVSNRHQTAKSLGRMGLLLVRKTPFAEDELARIRSLAARMNFEVGLQPGSAASGVLLALATGRGMAPLRAGPVDYEAPTDDKPFFFHMARPSEWLLMRGGVRSPASGAAAVLGTLLFTVIGLAAFCIVVPLAFARIGLVRGDALLLGFFCAIGTGFMLIEISMLQRLILFLGHPVYSLSVILFVLLLSGGLGSWLSGRIADERLARRGPQLLALLVGVLAVAGWCAAPLIAAFGAAETPVRIAASGALLAVMGVPMGMAFPLGMRLALASRAPLAPWLWGVNGAASVVASVLAVVIAMAVGISASFWSGVAAYALALATFALACRGRA